MTYADYYRQKFRADLLDFISSLPSRGLHHSANKAEYTIQYSRLTKGTKHIDVIQENHRDNFVVALFFTVLVDMVFYTYYKPDYPKFQKLTMYPKFIGDCLSACRVHFHPSAIFEGVNNSSWMDTTISGRPDINPSKSFNQAIGVMKNEVYDFFEKHMQQIDPEEFWNRCTFEFPHNLISD